METIEKNGEFEKYVDMLDEREQKERRDLRRRKRERGCLRKVPKSVKTMATMPNTKMDHATKMVRIANDSRVTMVGTGSRKSPGSN